jgi:hypothetical protein
MITGSLDSGCRDAIKLIISEGKKVVRAEMERVRYIFIVLVDDFKVL